MNKEQEMKRIIRLIPEEVWHERDPDVVTDPLTGRKWLRGFVPADAHIVDDRT